MIRSRGHTFGLLVGIAVGMVVVGLAVPFVVGSSTSESPLLSAADEPAIPRATGDTGPMATSSDPAMASAPDATGASVDAPATTPTTAAAGAKVQASTSLTATDRGVTATTVTLGFPLYNLGAAGRVGLAIEGLDPEAQTAIIQAIVDHINDEGGINGRRIKPVYQPVDVLDQDSANAACLALTEDAPSFAVLGDLLYQSASQCVTNHDTILLTNTANIADDTYASGRGLLFGMFPRGSRMMANFAAKLGQLDALRGTKIGILGAKGFDPAGRTMATLAAAVEREGGTVVRATNLSEDQGVASSQVPVEVSQMRGAGAEVILFLSGFLNSTQFAQQADSQGYVPKYYVSDWSGMYVSNVNENMPPSYHGTLVVTTTRDSDFLFGVEPPPAARCRGIYEQRAGRKLGDADHDYAMVQCDLLFSFVKAARLAGANLTRVDAAAQLQRMGPIESAFWGGGTFRPGKFDMADQIQVDRWDRGCKCFRPDTPFEPGRY